MTPSQVPSFLVPSNKGDDLPLWIFTKKGRDTPHGCLRLREGEDSLQETGSGRSSQKIGSGRSSRQLSSRAHLSLTSTLHSKNWVRFRGRSHNSMVFPLVTQMPAIEGVPGQDSPTRPPEQYCSPRRVEPVKALSFQNSVNQSGTDTPVSTKNRWIEPLTQHQCKKRIRILSS